MKKRPEIISLLLLIFALSIIVVLLNEMRRNLPKTDQSVPTLPAGEKYGVVDTMYVDLAYYFSVPAPDSLWQISALSHDTSFQIMDTSKAILPQIPWAVRLTKMGESDTMAVLKIGAMKLLARIPDRELAITMLHELMLKYERNGRRIRIIRPVSQPAHHLLQGSYFVIVLPENARVSRPVFVVSVLPRGNLFYFIIATTSERDYPSVKDDLQKIVGSFRPLSFSIKSKPH